MAEIRTQKVGRNEPCPCGSGKGFALLRGSLGRFLLRPKGGGASIKLSLGEGDLLVMGGSCQRTWQHAVPKVARAAERIAIMFRPTWQEDDPSYG